MSTRRLEIAVGLFVAAGLAALFLLAMRVSNLSALGGEGGYRITARFADTGGLKVRAPVTVAGVRVGRVADVRLDTETHEAIVTMSVERRFSTLPADSVASIRSVGLLGEHYVGLEPGGDPQHLVDGSEIRLTQSAVSLDQLIGQFLFNKPAPAETPTAPTDWGSSQ